MKRAGIFVITCILIALLCSDSSSAHVLIQDTTKNYGAILHITPDDDPIAGKKAVVYFDAQDVFSGSAEAKLLITQEKSSEAVAVDTKRDGSLVVAEYTFPHRGVYMLRYKIQSGGAAYVFEQSVRVSRGVGVGRQVKPRYAWAEMTLLAAVAGLVVLAIVGCNRRREIARQSIF